MPTDPLAKVEAALRAAAETAMSSTGPPDVAVNIYRHPSGDFIVPDKADSRGWRAATNREIENMEPSNVDYTTPGTTFTERATVKNLASNVGAMTRYMESRGYETRPFPSKRGANFNVLVRKRGSSGAWRPVDPSASADPVEFLRDISDWVGDMTVGTISTMAGLGASAALGTAGTAAGPVGMAAGIGLGLASGAAAGESARQWAGGLAGIPQNESPNDAIVSAAFAPLGPVIGKGASGVMRSAGRGLSHFGRGAQTIQRQVGASIIGVQKSGTLDPEEILGGRAADPRDVLPTMKKAAEDVVGFFMALERKGPRAKWMTYPEKIAATNMEAQATKAGATIDGRPLIDLIWRNLADPEKVELERNFGKQVEGVSAFLHAYLQRKVGPNADFSKIPPDAMVEMKRFLQRFARRKGTYQNQPIEDEFRNFLGAASKEARIAMIDGMDNAGFPDYRTMMAAIDHKESTRRAFKTLFGLTRKEMPSGQGQVPYAVLQRVEEYLHTIYGSSKGTSLQLMRDLEGEFNVRLEPEVLAANIGAAFGREGRLSLRPRITATGGLMNVGTMLGAAGLFKFGHPAAAALVAGGGLAAATPAAQVGITRAVDAAARRLPMEGRALISAVNSAAPGAVLGGARSVVTSEEQRRKRGPTVLG